MLDSAPLHPNAAFALDIADKAIKAVAVLLGGVWTYWNYRKSRTHAQKLELGMTSNVLSREFLFLDIAVTLENVGAARQLLEPDNVFCTHGCLPRHV